MKIAYPYDIRYWLALSHSLTNKAFFNLLHHYKDPTTICHTSVDDLAATSRLSRQKVLIKPDWRLIDRQIETSRQKNIHIITWRDHHYPQRLREISSPPPLLFVIGNLNALSSYQLAMVGSRTPSFEGVKNAYHFALSLGKLGLNITSGLAFGIDKACHQGALAASIPTVAVLGSGLDVIYPHTHHFLAKKIIENQGALVSEFPLGTPPKSTNFPQQNRIISGLSLGTLVVEAALRSGSLITARFALEQNREVFAIPGSIMNPLAAGCNQLIKQGAKLVEKAEDVLEELHFPKAVDN